MFTLFLANPAKYMYINCFTFVMLIFNMMKKMLINFTLQSMNRIMICAIVINILQRYIVL
jgi:hypothetical protein